MIMEYEFKQEYFVSNDDDTVTLSGKNTFSIGFDSDLSQKVLGKLHALGKPYVSFAGEEVIEKPKPKPKKKKVKIDEPKKQPKEAEDTTESDLPEEGES